MHVWSRPDQTRPDQARPGLGLRFLVQDPHVKINELMESSQPNWGVI